LSALTLKYDDVEWERDGRGDRVVIGSGVSGIVYAGRLRGAPVAIKGEVLRADNEVLWKKAVQLHVRATSPHIVAVHGIIVDSYGGKVTHYIVMERLADTVTALLLTRGGAHYGADVTLRLKLLADVAGGLAYMHASHTIHGDIKPENVLLTASMPPAAKLADFGSSVLRREGTHLRESHLGARGTPLYMDPRLFNSRATITTASDVYSFGVMAWQVLTGLVPYEAEMIKSLLPTATVPEKLEALRKHVVGGGRPPVAALVERGVPSAVVELIQECWAPKQEARPTMAVVQRALAVYAPLAYEWNNKLVLDGDNHPVFSLALLPGGRLASGNKVGAVRLWNAVRSEEPSAVLEGYAGQVLALAALPDGRRLAAGMFSGVGGKAGAIVVWNTGGGKPARPDIIDCGSGVCALAVLRADRLAAGCGHGVHLVDLRAGAVTATLEGHTNDVATLAVLPAGMLASGSDDKTVRLWDVGARKCVATLEGHTDSVSALAVLTDGRLASGSEDTTVWLWDVATRTCAAVLRGHTCEVMALAALPDGRLASGSFDQTIRVWDTRPAATAAAAAASAAAGGTPVAVLAGHDGSVNALQPLPGGCLASGSADKTVRLWRLPAAAP